MDGGEMWSRWDMQDHAPDIFITNYSMLNIMLMRGVETTIFDQTRSWLQADPSHLFNLVVDELHTYRGTPGTEVAYLIRVLLDRIGLGPNSDQLRIIASSASIAAGTAGLQYLEAFFGRDRSRFEIVGASTQPLTASAFDLTRANEAALRQLRTELRTSQSISVPAANAFNTAVGGSASPSQATAEQILDSALEHIHAADALRLACATGPLQSPQLQPKHPEEIATAAFPGLPPSSALEATEGLLAGLSSARGVASAAPLPLRAHLFFRNLQGLWACTNPACNQAPPRAGVATVPVVWTASGEE
jgi:ATP-dependent helicase YprA (DUF1998 family)